MISDYEIDEDQLEENEVLFFKCKDCGSRTLDTVCIIDVTQTIDEVLPCQCGNEEYAAYVRTRTVELVQHTGYLGANRHVFTEESQTIDELEREVEDEQIICKKCYEKFNEESRLWQIVDTHTDENNESGNLTITCNGCGREIEFGYSHANKQGRIFLGDDDSDFNPWKTFPDQKYLEIWRKRGWLRPVNDRREII
jgi:hypothetical protein